MQSGPCLQSSDPAACTGPRDGTALFDFDHVGQPRLRRPGVYSGSAEQTARGARAYRCLYPAHRPGNSPRNRWRVNADNIAAIATAGADTFVAGSAIFRQPDYRAAIQAMRSALADCAVNAQ